MSELKTGSAQKLKTFIKEWAIKLVEGFVFVFAYIAIFFFRAFIGVILIVVGIVLFFSTVILGSRRSAVWMNIVADILKKYPI